MKRINLMFSVVVWGLLSYPLVAQVGKKGEAAPPAPAEKTSAKKSKSTGKNSTAAKKSSSSKRANRAAKNDDTNSSDADVERKESKATEISYWESIKGSGDPEDFKSYLKKYPEGEFADLARNRIRKLEVEAREAAERAEAARLSKEKEDRERVERERAESERLAREGAERAQREKDDNARAQMRGLSKEDIYKGFLNNYKNAQSVAYQYAQEYVRRYSSDNDQYVSYLKRWVSAYESVKPVGQR